MTGKELFKDVYHRTKSDLKQSEDVYGLYWPEKKVSATSWVASSIAESHYSRETEGKKLRCGFNCRCMVSELVSAFRLS